MAVTIVQSSQYEDGYVSKDIVTIMIGDEDEIKNVSTDYSPGSFAYTADLTVCWNLSSNHEWIQVKSNN